MIEVKNLVKKYGKHVVLDNVTFDIDRGGIVALVGNNGVGKTTLFKIIMQDIQSTSGEIKVFNSSSRLNIVENVHFMNEQNKYYDRRLDKIIASQATFDKNFDSEKCKELLKLFKLQDNLYFSKLSKGMRNQFNIAIALCSSRKIILLDEPTSGLDEISRFNFYKILSEEAQNSDRLILLSTHTLEELGDLADRIILIYDNGKAQLLNVLDINSMFLRVTGDVDVINSILLNKWRDDSKTLGSTLSCIIYNDLSYADKKVAKANNIELTAIATHEACRILVNDEMFKVVYETND